MAKGPTPLLTQRYHTSEDVFDRVHSWQYRTLLAAFPADPMGLIVRAVLGRNSRVGAALGLEAEIGKDGIVRTKLRGPLGNKLSDAHPLGSIQSLRDEFRRLADHCKLNDDERVALFEELKKWCGRDLRATSK